MLNFQKYISSQDIDYLVQTTARAGAPFAEELLLKVAKEHHVMFKESTTAMQDIMRESTVTMQQTIDRQGRLMIAIMALAGWTMATSQLWRASSTFKEHLHATLMYGGGIAVVLLFHKWA
eukprot:GEMP01121294.1.p1 GENE.GEMP01121294.1~~GEMP01121294.1.p1  ORF type:complete len:130 (+),score=15.73 GEMP01121294.1:33-392(+)